MLAALPADDRLLAREVAQRWRAVVTSRTAVWRRVDVAACSLGSSAMVCAALACMRVAVERSGGVAGPMELDCGDLYLSDELRHALSAAPPLAVLRIRTTSLDADDELVSKAGVGVLHCHLTVDPFAANLAVPAHVRVNLLTFRTHSHDAWPSVRTFLEAVRPTRVRFRNFGTPAASYLAALRDVADLGVRGIYLVGCTVDAQVAAALVRAAPRELWLETIATSGDYNAPQHMEATIRQLCQGRRLERFAFSFSEHAPPRVYEPEWSLAVAGALTDVPHVTYLGTESRPCNGNNSVTAALLSNPGIRSLCSTLTRCQPVLSALQGNHTLTELHLKLADTTPDYTSDCLGPVIRLLSAASVHNRLSTFGMAFGDAPFGQSDCMVERGAFVGAVAGLIRCRCFERLTLDGADVVSLGADEWGHIFDAIRSPTPSGRISFSFLQAHQPWEVTGAQLVNLFDRAMADRRRGPLESFELEFPGFVCPQGPARDQFLRLRSEGFLLRGRRFGAYGFKEAYQYESWRWE